MVDGSIGKGPISSRTIAEQLAKGQGILTESRKAYHPSELPAHLQNAVAEARMAAEHAPFDRLLAE